MNDTLCGAQRRRSVETCKRPAGAGTDHRGRGRCSWHGGASPTHARAAVVQDAQERARAELARLGVDPEPIENPYLAVAEMAAVQRQWHRYWLERVKAIDPADIRYAGITAEQVRAEITVCQNAADQCARTLIALAKLSSEEVLSRISKRQAEMMAEALSRAFGDVSLTG